ncbi:MULTISPECIES: NYN domain-containing protein [Salimicrobium]|uniref:NYN domain-containing protein n=3 Tax=Salimicrobium TaxID=351195 RepID=K2G7L4_9BACI|nr:MULTISPECIES: NYN domain-containing protein [Salimicrobium]AKG05612.1 hypothetical protein AAV35_013165 [Salimicrobium jeotgali]EKE30392.1 hypothetical protein MJ3_13164 [Salimicrobium jeotgali]MBM7696535.1 putative RNA-binding protein with PIN domain [Salimicrobium jeotgali]SDY24368.1 hypothetical protein SAMN04488081_2450 [Salimicrobium album]SIS93976.1 hypothetical protein SAMN05421758_11163 [Salimicrobium salexigens]
MNILLVDGYNMIGAWPELKELRDHDLSGARDLLIGMLAEYQSYRGERVIVVFDAYHVRGMERKQQSAKIEVIYTKENETADERIEKLSGELNDVRTKVYVATSDYAQQRVIFAQGAYRISARELYIDIGNARKAIEEDVSERTKKTKASKIQLKEEVRDAFEKWRRGNH